MFSMKAESSKMSTKITFVEFHLCCIDIYVLYCYNIIIKILLLITKLFIFKNNMLNIIFI